MRSLVAEGPETPYGIPDRTGPQTETKATLRYISATYIDSGAGGILIQLLFLVAVVAVLIWLFGRAIRRR